MVLGVEATVTASSHTESVDLATKPFGRSFCAGKVWKSRRHLGRKLRGAIETQGDTRMLRAPDTSRPPRAGIAARSRSILHSHTGRRVEFATSRRDAHRCKP